MDEQEPILQAQIFKPGPLHDERREIVKSLDAIPIKTGDLFFRLGKQTFMGIPFENLVAYATRSRYSHASVALMRGEEIWMLEVNDMGTMLIHIKDWLDYCAVKDFSVYRLPLTADQIQSVEKSIWKFWDEDPDYDFTFEDLSKYYCTESVAKVYEDAGVPLARPMLIKDILTRKWTYPLVVAINWVIQKISGAGLPINTPAYFVGNDKIGLASTPGLELVYDNSTN